MYSLKGRLPSLLLLSPSLTRSFTSSSSSEANVGRCTRTTKDGALIPSRPEKFFADYTTLSRAEIIRLWRSGQISVTPPSPHENQGFFSFFIFPFLFSFHLLQKKSLLTSFSSFSFLLSPFPSLSPGSFMSDILVYGDDQVAVNGHPLLPSLLPFHPQYGHVPRSVSELGGGENEGEVHPLEWKKEVFKKKKKLFHFISFFWGTYSFPFFLFFCFQGPVVPTMVLAVNKPTGMVVSRPSSAGERNREEMNILSL